MVIYEKQERKNGFLGRRIKRKLYLALALVVVLIAIVLGYGSGLMTQEKVTKLGFEDMGVLTTQAAYVTEVKVLEGSKELFGMKVPFTESKYIYSYDVVVKAGIDFAEVQWEVQDTTIVVSMPPVTVTDCAINPSSFRIFHEEESIFRPFTMEETNDALIELEKTAQQNAVANELLENAKNNAEVILTGFFGQQYDLETYTLEFVS